MKAWDNAGFPLRETPQPTVHALKEHLEDWQVLDVRAPDEWEGGHIPGARHAFVADMRDGLDGASKLNRKQPVAVYCDSGYRASLAASWLEREGFAEVRNIPGSWQAWKRAGYEIEN